MSYTLIPCPFVGTHRLQRNDESRALIVDSLLVRFTPTEYRLLMPLLEGKPVMDKNLTQCVFSREDELWMRENLDKHIDKMRCKLRPSGLDIYRITKYGYILLASAD